MEGLVLRLYLVIQIRASAKNGAAKSGTPSRTSSQEQREGTELGLFPDLLAGLSGAQDPPRAVPAWPGGTNKPPKQPKPGAHTPTGWVEETTWGLWGGSDGKMTQPASD